MNEQKYEQTGNKIPLTIDELMQCVFDRLDIYDSIGGGNNTASTYNPYIHPIIYNTRDGRTVQIPEDIQQRAINERPSKKNYDEQQDQYNGPPGFSMDRQSPPTFKDIDYSQQNREEMAESQEYIQPPVNLQDDVDNELFKKYIQDYNKDKDDNVVTVKDNNYKLLIAVIAMFLLLGFYLHKKGKLKF
jgi:hypothetical protein